MDVKETFLICVCAHRRNGHKYVHSNSFGGGHLGGTKNSSTFLSIPYKASTKPLCNRRNRFRGFYSVAKAAQRSDDLEEARTYYGKLVALCSSADTQRPELTEAKKYLPQK